MPKKILVVDDEPHILKVIAARLKSNNYDVIMASDAMYAVKKAHEEKPDLIILDIRMPAGGGINVFENLRMTTDTMLIPVIFITAYPSTEIERKVLEMGAECFVTKPFNADDLLAKIRKTLGEDVEKKENA